jgi:hypothetical protein
MERDELRALQAPLKERYADDATAAVVTLSAGGTLGEGISCSVQTGRALAEAGLDTDADAEQLATLVRLTERHAVPFAHAHAAGDRGGSLGYDRGRRARPA